MWIKGQEQQQKIIKILGARLKIQEIFEAIESSFQSQYQKKWEW